MSLIFLLSGGVVGAAILLGLGAFWFVLRRRRRGSHSAFPQQRPVNRDVPQVDKDGNEYPGLPQYSVPEPDLVPDSSTRAMSEVASTRSASLFTNNA
jgi:hypothetical protein